MTPALAILAMVVSGEPPPDVTRFCVETDGTVVVENDCGCNDELVCTAEQTGKTITVRVAKRPDRPLLCDDCFPMVKGRCALPSPANGKVEVRAGALKLSVELARGKPRAQVCATRAAR